MDSETEVAEPTRLTGADFGFGNKTQLNINGFALICAWHFLILFSGLFSDTGRLIPLQLVLFCMLAATYFVFGLFSESIEAHVLGAGLKRFRLVNISIGILGSVCAGVLTYMTAVGFDNLYLLGLAYAVVGFTEATLMYPWLQMPRAAHRKGADDYRNLAFNMGLGSLVALCVANLQHPIYEIVASLLPLASSVLLVFFWGTSQALRQLSATSPGQKRKPGLAKALGANIGFVFCGIAFGLAQGAFSADGHLVYLCDTAWPALGATLSAVLIFVLPAEWLRTHGVAIMQRVSLLFFIAGAAIMCWPVAWESAGASYSPLAHLLSQGLVLCGFNVFDFGYMVFAFIWASKLKAMFAPYVAYNRAILYASMALGLVGGWGLSFVLGSGDTLAVFTVEVCIVLLAFTTLPFFDSMLPYNKIMVAESLSSLDKDEAKNQDPDPKIRKRVRFNELVDLVSETYGLSRREKEVFRCLAKGRNATYIQQELTISINTARTHISNIYRKLDVHSLQDLLDLMDAVASEHAPDLKGEQNGGEGGGPLDKGTSGEGSSGTRSSSGRA